MAYDIKDNSGSVFKNERRREGKNDSQYAGSSICLLYTSPSPRD